MVRVRVRLAACWIFTWASLGVAAMLTAAARPLVAAPSPAPTRIVSTAPSITETLFALGLGDRVVGVSIHCRYPAQVLALPKVGSFFSPDAELIASLRPDFVFVHSAAGGLDRRLAAVHIPFAIVRHDDVASIFTAIHQIADAAGVSARASPLAADLMRQLDSVRQGATSRPRRRVLFIIGRSPGMLADLVAVGHGSYLDELIDAAGGVNVLGGKEQVAYPRISMETVLRLDPDVIVDTVDMGDTDAERAARRPVNERLWRSYGQLSAVRNRRVYAATTDALVVPGPRVAEAAAWIAALLRRDQER